jgi:hypothetical protein
MFLPIYDVDAISPRNTYTPLQMSAFVLRWQRLRLAEATELPVLNFS